MYLQQSKKVFALAVLVVLVVCAVLLLQPVQLQQQQTSLQPQQKQLQRQVRIQPERKEVGVVSSEVTNTKWRLVPRGEFYVLTNYVRADQLFARNESVTFAAPADPRFLDDLVPLIERWEGPVSVALYTPGYDFDRAVETIACLRQHHLLVKRLVSFHLFFERHHLPNKVNKAKA